MRYYLRQRLHHIAHTMDIIRRVILSLIFWGIVILIIVAIWGNRPPSVKSGSLLVLNPQGILVDAYTAPVSYRGVPVAGYMNETLLDDLVTALDMASADPRINGLWVNLSNMTGGGAAAVGELADAVKQFGESGKNIVTSADTYDNSRYRIASSSDYILVDRLGEVFPTGYGYWRAYYAEGLEKFGVEAELFRSGKSKTGAENYILDHMSEQARQDETRLLSDLWGSWISEVAVNRKIDSAYLSEWINNYDKYLSASGGDGSKSALDAGLVDRIETGGVLDELLERQFGSDETRRIDAIDYVMGQYSRKGKDGTVAVIPVVGTLVYGEGAAGTAGSSDIVQAITNARDTNNVKALVIRIDSPGGDVRAGEAVRRALEETRNRWGLPIVISMGNLAASGG
ncbi:MAG: S49 family peptidase, partial [Spirochaetaceae bacterium]|nr:S49 family peptidase [Spirochaetaceae bacterium]